MTTQRYVDDMMKAFKKHFENYIYNNDKESLKTCIWILEQLEEEELI